MRVHIGSKTTAMNAIRHTEQGDIIPALPALTGADVNIRGPGKEFRLKEALKPLKYDYVVIDTPPALGILLVNALTAATGCIIPLYNQRLVNLQEIKRIRIERSE